MGYAAYRRRLYLLCQGITLRYKTKVFNKNPKARNNGEWLKDKPRKVKKRKRGYKLYLK